MKKVLLLVADPIGARIRSFLTTFAAASFVTDAKDADVALVRGRKEVYEVLEATPNLPILQLVHDDAVRNSRVTPIVVVACLPQILFALWPDTPLSGR